MEHFNKTIHFPIQNSEVWGKTHNFDVKTQEIFVKTQVFGIPEHLKCRKNKPVIASTMNFIYNRVTKFPM